MGSSEIDRLGDEIAEVAGHLNAATHRLLALIREFDEQCGWAENEYENDSSGASFSFSASEAVLVLGRSGHDRLSGNLPNEALARG